MHARASLTSRTVFAGAAACVNVATMVEVVESRQIVLAAVIERGGRYLVCQRPAHKRHGSLWEFPGGKVEAGESLMEAARRELKEELRMRATEVGRPRLSVAEDGSNFVICFADVEAEGEPVLLEHSALDWLTVEQLLALPLAPSDRLFVEHMSGKSTPGNQI